MTPVTALILPGLGNSGPEHWQSQFERIDPTCLRVMQDEWDAPRCADWAMRLESAIAAAPGHVVLVSHSSSCALVAHWAASAPRASLAKVRGALLVAPSDPEGPNYPLGPTGFSPVPMTPLPFRTIVVASDDDQYVTIERAREYAAAWRASLVELHAAGHINVAAGFGPWPEGYALLQSLRDID
jgi:hypothetical protein